MLSQENLELICMDVTIFMETNRNRWNERDPRRPRCYRGLTVR
jgi:hypothetical protein